MTDIREPARSAGERPIAEEVPSDSRRARQLIRRRLIAEAVMATGSMRIEELTDRFGVSLMTAHRDLDDLVGRGLLRKTRGVVSAAPASLIGAGDAGRSGRQSAEKAAIAEAAMAFVEPGQAIFLDESATVLGMARRLQGKTPLTAITNSLTLMNALRGVRDLTLIGLGGQFFTRCDAFIGAMTQAEIGRLRADTLFLSMPAITDDLTFHPSAEMVETKRAMFDAAATRILLADHTRFERRALHGLAALTEFDVVIVDDGAPAVHLDRMRAKGINVVVAPVARAAAPRAG